MDDQLSLHRLFACRVCWIAILTGDLVTADREIAGMTRASATRLNAPFWLATGRTLEAKVMVSACVRGSLEYAARHV